MVVRSIQDPYIENELYFVPYYLTIAPGLVAGYSAFRNGNLLGYGFRFQNFINITNNMKKVKCINVKPLPGNDVAPPLELGKIYEVKHTIEERVIFRSKDDKSVKHYDVGLVSKFNYVNSYHSAKAHWCHESRFEEVTEI